MGRIWTLVVCGLLVGCAEFPERQMAADGGALDGGADSAIPLDRGAPGDAAADRGAPRSDAAPAPDAGPSHPQPPVLALAPQAVGPVGGRAAAPPSVQTGRCMC